MKALRKHCWNGFTNIVEQLLLLFFSIGVFSLNKVIEYLVQMLQIAPAHLFYQKKKKKKFKGYFVYTGSVLTKLKGLKSQTL